MMLTLHNWDVIYRLKEQVVSNLPKAENFHFHLFTCLLELENKTSRDKTRGNRDAEHKRKRIEKESRAVDGGNYSPP